MQSRRLVIWVVQLVVIVLMMVLLKLLLQMANEFIEGRETRRSSSPQAKDNFRNRDEGQGWSWDFAVVVNVEDEGHFEAAPRRSSPLPREQLARKHSLRKMLVAMRGAGLETYAYKSRNLEFAIVLIRGSAAVLKKHADAIDLKVKLNEAEVRNRISEGLRDANDPNEFIAVWKATSSKNLATVPSYVACGERRVLCASSRD
mmetsp:Transcript_9192/g.29836  ORF Transcript_9192/g.29836 Transcript_9192/m.29836 type:complete len:202 (-) Transcript_9192:1615-2220(-)